MDDEDLDNENDRELNENRVREYVEQAQSTIESAPQMQEATTKAAVLRDFLDLLNWEIPTDTQLEYSVKAFNRTYKVDYALILEGTPVAFLEAKGVDTPLTQKHREQLQHYLKNEDVNWGILTNGKEYEFYRREVVDSKVQVNSLTSTQLADLPANMTFLRAFTKDAIRSGESKNFADQIRELEDALHTLDSEKAEIAEQITSLLTKCVSETIKPHAESQAKETIDRLRDDIAKEISMEQTDIPKPDYTPKSTGGKIVPRPDRNAVVGTIKRQDISGSGDASVVVFPTKQSGIEFLKENNAWGFVRIGKEPEYITMYVSDGVQEVKYIAKIQDLVDPTEAELARPLEAYYESGSDEAQAGFDPDKKVIVFEEDSLYELEEPIPFENKWLQSLRYTTLGELKAAKTTDDIL